MKKIISAFVSMLLVISLTACGNSRNSAPEDTSAVSETTASAAETVQKSGFTVDGTKLLDANGSEFVFRGINHAHSWFRDQDTTALDRTDSSCKRYPVAEGRRGYRKKPHTDVQGQKTYCNS